MKVKPRSPFCIHPRVRTDARGEIRTLIMHGLSMPPLPSWATRADARGGIRTRTGLCLREPPLPSWVTRALTAGAGGEIRTHKNRLLRAARLPFAPLPPESAGGGTRTLKGPRAPDGDLSAARLPFTPLQLEEEPFPPTPGEGLEPSSPTSKAGALPLDDSGRQANPARLERAPSGSASLRSDPSELRVRGKCRMQSAECRMKNRL